MEPSRTTAPNHVDPGTQSPEQHASASTFALRGIHVAFTDPCFSGSFRARLHRHRLYHCVAELSPRPISIRPSPMLPRGAMKAMRQSARRLMAQLDPPVVRPQTSTVIERATDCLFWAAPTPLLPLQGATPQSSERMPFRRDSPMGRTVRQRDKIPSRSTTRCQL